MLKNGIRSLVSKLGYRLVRKELDAGEVLNYLKRANITRVLDVGAASGVTVERWLRDLPRASVVAFEPRASAFLQLEKLRKAYPDRLSCFNCVLGDIDGEVEFNVHEDHETSSSLLRATSHSAAIMPFTSKESVVKVASKRLDSVFCKLPPSTGVQLLKLDVQGAEHVVLSGATETLKEIKFVLSEVTFEPVYQSQCDFGGLNNIMMKNEFKLIGFIEQCHLADGRPLYADVLYENTR